MKRIVCSIIAFLIVCSISLNSFAVNDAGQIVASTIVHKDGNMTTSSQIITPDGPVYEYGTTKIDDYLANESGWVQSSKLDFPNFDVFSVAAIRITKYIPVVGAYIQTGWEIYNDLKTIYSSLGNIQVGHAVWEETNYTYRYFSHLLYAYDYTNSWKRVGESTSKYYYKQLYMRYYDGSVGEYRTATKQFSHSYGYSPCTRSTAPNYMNYSILSQKAYTAWSTGFSYSEAYPIGG